MKTKTIMLHLKELMFLLLMRNLKKENTLRPHQPFRHLCKVRDKLRQKKQLPKRKVTIFNKN